MKKGYKNGKIDIDGFYALWVDIYGYKSRAVWKGDIRHRHFEAKYEDLRVVLMDLMRYGVVEIREK